MEDREIAAAEGQFARILAREPDNARAWLGVGLVRMYRQQHSEAVAALQRAAELLPSSSGVFVALGWATIVARDLAGAEKVFRHALEVDRNFGEAHGGLATVLALQGRIDDARNAITRARRLNPQGFGAAFAQTLVLKQQGQEREAIDLLSNMLMQAPRQDAQPLIEQIRIYASRNPLFGRSNPNQKGPRNEPPAR
jgi:tetratricopeptide (TPR) repeat protein